MSTTTLHDYIASHLKEPVDSERLLSFLGQSEVFKLVNQLEDLMNQLTVCWQQDTVQQEPSESGLVDTNSSPQSDDSLINQGISAMLTSADADQEKNGSLTEGDNTPQQTLVSSSASNISSVPHSEEITTAPMRFTPTPDSPPAVAGPLKTLSMANATVGKPYVYTFDFRSMGLPELADPVLKVDTATGLTYDLVKQTVSGTPLAAGEFLFELTYQLTITEPDRPTLSQSIKLLVNPDPRSLWKDLPSDTHDAYYKPDSDQGLISDGDTRLVAASVRGRSHAHEGKFRDDDFDLEHLAETGWYLLSVADGAGSALYSRRGAQLACQTVTQYLKTSIEPQSWERLETSVQQYSQNQQDPIASTVKRHLYEVLGKAVFAAYKAIESEAQIKNTASKDYATTLITVLAKPVSGGWFVGGFWVGDGGVGIYRADGEPLLLGIPDGGEYAGQTRFLTMPETIATNFFDRFRIAFVTDFTAIVLMTDGITDPKFQTDNNLARKEKWDELWAELQQSVSFADEQSVSAQLQDWLGFWSPGNHDDRTIALLYTHANNPKN